MSSGLWGTTRLLVDTRLRSIQAPSPLIAVKTGFAPTLAQMSTQQESRNRSTESVIATHGSSNDADLPIPGEETCQEESLPFEAPVLEDLSNSLSGTTTFHRTSTPSALLDALSPDNPKEAEEVTKKIDQAKGEKLLLRSIHHLTEISDVIRDFQKAFYHQNGPEKLEPSSITTERNVAKDDPHSKRA